MDAANGAAGVVPLYAMHARFTSSRKLFTSKLEYILCGDCNGEWDVRCLRKGDRKRMLGPRAYVCQGAFRV